MMKWCFFGYASQYKSKEDQDRWYFGFHGPEVARAVGPWLTRYETWRGYDPPAEAKRWGALSGRYTEIWWRNVEDFKEADIYNAGPYSGAPGSPEMVQPPPPQTNSLVTAKHTEDFLGKPPPRPWEKPILRWVRVFRYPDGVSREDGEKWYLNTYTQQVKTQEGLLLYRGHKTILPSPLPQGERWHRYEELWYQDFDAWRKANVESPPKYTPPPWGGKEEPFVEMLSHFLDRKPQADFLRYLNNVYPQVP